VHTEAAFTEGWLIFAAMVAALLAAQFWRKQPIGLSLLYGAIAGALVAGKGIPIRHLVEGAFTYFDAILIIYTAMLFMRVIEENGTLGALAVWIIRKFGRIPSLLTAIVTLFIMFPAMLTGITTTSVLTTGALIAPALVALGLPRGKVAAVIAISAVMGMIAPPINLLAMLIGQGVDMPYIGFEVPLLAVSLPIALLSSYILVYPHLRRSDPAVATDFLNKGSDSSLGFMGILPLLIVFGLMAGIRIFPKYLPDIGIPAIFILGTLLALATGKRVGLWNAANHSLLLGLPVLGLLAGVGAFLQVMTLTGVRGLLVASALSLPPALKYVGLLVSLPLFGGVSAFASAMVFGVPFLLSLLGNGSEILICAAISALAGLGDVLPPSAINARFSAQVVGDVTYLAVIRRCIPFVVISALFSLGLIYAAPHLMR